MEVKVYMHPVMGSQLSGSGKYLIHAEGIGAPHCFALEVWDNMVATISDGGGGAVQDAVQGSAATH